MVIRQHGAQRLAAHDLDLDARGPDRRPHEPGVEQPEAQEIDLLRGVRLAQRDLDLGGLLAQLAHEQRQDAVRERADEAERESPRRARSDGRDDRERALGRRQRAARLGQQRAAGRRQLDVAPVAPEELDTELALEPPDLLRERRLRHLQARGRAAEVELVRNGEERTKMT